MIPVPGEVQFLLSGDGSRMRTVHLGDAGSDDLVVLVGGLGASADTWGSVLEGVAPHAHVVAYDRLGYGYSDAQSRPSTLHNLADDLTTLVKQIPHKRLVLAGHSWGGPIVRVATQNLREAGQTPVGIVLVDASDENAELYFTPGSRRLFSLQRILVVPLARFGLLRKQIAKYAELVPEGWREGAIYGSSSVTSARGIKGEYRSIVDGMEFLRDNVIEDAGVPARVLSGTDMSIKGDKYRAQFNEAHRKTAARLSAPFVAASKSGHMIPFTEPDLVITQILELLRA